jgi:uncharacterized protein
MQDVFEKLRGLQDILSRKIQIETEIRDIPKSMATKSELVNRLKKSYIEKNNQYEQVREKINTIKTRMSEAEQLREKYESQMDVIKTQREYEALDKEIRDASEKEMQYRKDLQKEEKVLEEMKYGLEREESMIKTQEAELNDEMEKIKSESEEKRKLLKQLEKEEQELVPGLNEEMLFKFDRIIRSKSGLGIVPLKRGVCTGCHMILPVQFVNEVRAGSGILFCPYCSRILFYEEDGEEAVYQDETEGLSDIVDFDLEDETEFDEEDILDEDDDSGDEEDADPREHIEEEDV